MERINQVERIHDRLYRLTELQTLHRYLVLGDEKALLIDTGFGFMDFRPLLETLTDLPVTVVNTHGHSDHGLGNCFFSKVYLHPKDIPILLAADNETAKKTILDYRFAKHPWFAALLDADAYLAQSLRGVEHLPVSEADVFDLGGISLTVYEVPGHSPGSIVLYCPQLRCLFGGDSVNSHPIWYVGDFDRTLPLPVFLRSLERLRDLGLDIRAIYPGHGQSPVAPETLEELIGCIRSLITCDESADPEIQNSGMTGRQHKHKNVSIVYSPAHLLALRDSKL